MAETEAAGQPGGRPNELQALHLVVLQHGLWGKPDNMNFLMQLLEARCQGLRTVVVNSDVNALYATYEGVDACGERLATFILDTCTALRDEGKGTATHLSLIGYSMGGLMTRYAVGRLGCQGILPGGKDWAIAPGLTPARSTDEPAPITAWRQPLQPVSFVTIATPHLGCWTDAQSWYGRAFGAMVPQVAARSGLQLMLLDEHAAGRPLLLNMADPELPFMRGLAQFRHLMLLANTLHDRTVPYCTAAITATNPYEEVESVAISATYPSIVRPGAPPTPRTATPKGAAAVCKRSAPQALSPEPEAAASDGGDASPTTSNAPLVDEDAAPVPRPRKGMAVRVVFLALAPLTVPLLLFMLGYMVLIGRKQWRQSAGRTYDHTWLDGFKPSQLKAAGAAAGPGDGPGRAGSGKPGLIAQLAGAAMSVPPSDVHSLTVRRGSLEQPRVGAAPPLAPGPARLTADVRAASVAENDIQVSIDGGSREFHVHEGLVDTLGSRERDAQLWMMRQLDELPWVKVDVDTRHYHAHAAIMLRMPERFKDNADCLQYLVDQLELDVVDTATTAT